MDVLDSLRLAAGGLRERKMRTALTLLGIVIGTSMIVALQASTQGQTKAISDQLEKLGPTTLIVQTQGRGQATSFTSSTLDGVRALDHVQTAFLAVQGDGTITRGGESDSVAIQGILPADLASLVKGLRIDQGDLYAEGDLTSALLGSTAATPTDTTKLASAPGDNVQVSVSVRQFTASGPGQQTTVSRQYVVSGVGAPFGSAPFFQVDSTVFVTPRAAQQILGLSAVNYNEMIVMADAPANVAAVQTELQTLLGNNARVQSSSQLATTITGVYSSVTSLLQSVAAISLVVAGVGIANTMFVSVIERTTEIGTLKALGFKGRQVLSIFLLEASLTGVIGGVLGSLAGVGVAFGIGQFISFSPTGGGGGGGGGGGPAQVVAATTQAAGRGGGGGGFGGGGGGFGGPPGGFGGGGGSFQNTASQAAAHATPVFTPDMFLIVIAFAIVVSVVAGLIPARKASKMDPVVALKRL